MAGQSRGQRSAESSRWLAGRVTSTPPSGPEGILAERLARGELDEEEYWHRIAIVRRATTPRPYDDRRFAAGDLGVEAPGGMAPR